MSLRLLFTAVSTALLAACDSGGAGRSAQSDGYATGQLATAESVQKHTDLSLDATAGAAKISGTVLGKQLAPEGSINATERTEQFSPGEPVHMAVEIADAPPETPVRVVWYGPRDEVRAEDIKPIQPQHKYISFTAAEPIVSDPGQYRAEVWIDDELVDERSFAVGDASSLDALLETSGG